MYDTLRGQITHTCPRSQKILKSIVFFPRLHKGKIDKYSSFLSNINIYGKERSSFTNRGVRQR